MFRFPWGDMHSLNLGWFLQKFNELRADWATAEENITGALDAEIQRAEDALSDVFDARDAAAASATAAAGSASTAGTSATAAQNSATAAGNSATLANNKATAAGLSEAAAAQSAAAAGNSATAAAGSATTASNAATNAAASETAAGNSASAAAASAASIEGDADAAAASATAAAQSETAAAASAAAAAQSAGDIPAIKTGLETGTAFYFLSPQVLFKNKIVERNYSGLGRSINITRRVIHMERTGSSGSYLHFNLFGNESYTGTYNNEWARTLFNNGSIITRENDPLLFPINPPSSASFSYEYCLQIAASEFTNLNSIIIQASTYNEGSDTVVNEQVLKMAAAGLRIYPIPNSIIQEIINNGNFTLILNLEGNGTTGVTGDLTIDLLVQVRH